jgi:hypothetical protein
MACSVQGRSKKERKVKLKVKSMLIIFFDNKGIVHKEFILKDQAVNSAYYCCFLWRLWKCVKTSPRTLATKELGVASLQHTISHFLFSHGIFFTKNNMTAISHPHYLLFSVSPIEDKTEGPPF